MSNSKLISLQLEGNRLCPFQHCLAEGLKNLCLGLSINLVGASLASDNQKQFQRACFDTHAGCLSYKSGVSEIFLVC